LRDDVAAAARTHAKVLILGDDRHGQGSRRASASLAEPEAYARLRGRELQRHPGDAPRVRAVRPHAGELHRRRQDKLGWCVRPTAARSFSTNWGR
jgi:hypothetical protein